jgi:hypothetical protein
MSIMPLGCFRISVHTDWSLSSEYFFFHTFTVNFNVYSGVCRYQKKNHFYPILGNLPMFGKHCVNGRKLLLGITFINTEMLICV